MNDLAVYQTVCRMQSPRIPIRVKTGIEENRPIELRLGSAI